MSGTNLLKRMDSKGRMSVRGAFGPGGALFKGRKLSQAPPNKAQAFQLEKCLDKKSLDKVIYQMTSSADTAAKNKNAVAEGRNSSGVAGKSYEYTVDGFAAFLAANKALGVLLFWKDAEEYTMLFGVEERKNVASKIFTRYLKQGAEWEVTALNAEMRSKIEKSLDDCEDDLFEELQINMYSVMLLELFPRFYEACGRETGDASASSSKISALTTFQDVLKAQDFEVHKFADYCRSILCEDQVIFLLEVADYRLLFSPSDLIDQATKIFATYLDPQSETRIPASDAECAKVGAVVENAKPTDALPLELFDKLYDEVFNTINHETWPSYKEKVLAGTLVLARGHSLSNVEGGGGEIDMTKPSKPAVAAALREPKRLECLRAAATAQGVRENVDFCVACQQYALLFSEADRKPKADAIWTKFLLPGCDAPVNLPDHMIQKMKKKIDTAEADAFELGYQELLLVISNNIYTHYLAEEAKLKEKEAADAASAAPAALPKQTGGCCLVQ